MPIGHVPRTMKILARGELTRQINPGDQATITGVYLPQPFYGMRGFGLSQDTYIEAYQFTKEKQQYAK